MAYHLDDTIAAIASPPGGAARGILRISGIATAQTLAACFVPQDAAKDLQSMTLASVVPGDIGLASSQRLPGRLYWWPNERSYTAQPAAEFHTLGSPPLLEAALASLCRAGARLAEPGEFTLRAFLAGRLDLTQAEAVLGVIDATGRSQLDAALVQLAGGLGGPLQWLRDDLLNLLAELEAGLDFVEEDIQFITPEELLNRLSSAETAVEATLQQLGSRGESTARPRVVLVGLPNVGKSCLFNALSGGEALVSPIQGTTRDYLAATIDCCGIPCELIDTAGYETAAAGSLESIAQDLRDSQHTAAQIELLCLDATRPPLEWEQQQLGSLREGRLLVLTKCDAIAGEPFANGAIRTSGLTGEGLPELRKRIADTLCQVASSETGVAATALRCGESLRLAQESLRRGVELVAESAPEELIAAEVRIALDELGRVVGAVYTDDILDRIFSRFCIGK